MSEPAKAALRKNLLRNHSTQLVNSTEFRRKKKLQLYLSTKNNSATLILFYYFITNSYKNLFGPVEHLNITLSQPLDNVLTDANKDMLSSDFTLKAIKEVVFNMAHNKACGPGGFPIEFYQHFWPIICEDLLLLFKDFSNGKLDISRINYGIVTLLPRGQGANKIQMYRPICLSNVLSKSSPKQLIIEEL